MVVSVKVLPDKPHKESRKQKDFHQKSFFMCNFIRQAPTQLQVHNNNFLALLFFHQERIAQPLLLQAEASSLAAQLFL
jgi:hypothetical protein